MNYMNAFNNTKDMILYWDEPTITMDYDDHEFHQYIRDNWRKNIIPNIVLSSATLPHQSELQETIADFISKFDNSRVYSIVSHDCNKSIPIINAQNYVEMPHLKYAEYDKLHKCITHCKNNLTMLRYFDLTEAVKFISYMNTSNKIRDDVNKITHRYHDLSELTMNNIKLHYLTIIEKTTASEWSEIYSHFQTKHLNIHLIFMWLQPILIHLQMDLPSF